MTLPLILLAIPSVVIGYITIEPLLFGNYFKESIYISTGHPGMAELAGEFHGPVEMVLHALHGYPFWFALAGVLMAWLFYLMRPDIPAVMQRRFHASTRCWTTNITSTVSTTGSLPAVRAARAVSCGSSAISRLIDGVMVNGTAKLVGLFSGVLRHLQSGYIYHYAFSMIIGVFVLLTVQELVAMTAKLPIGRFEKMQQPVQPHG